MKCPLDQTTLTIADRQGIEIDFCPTCRGVWLDRGELDKLIERANVYQQPSSTPRYEERSNNEHRDRDRDHDDDDRRSGHDNRHHKKESFMGDLFDF
jgi:uncharacterized protein